MKGIFSTELNEIEQQTIKSKYNEALLRLNSLQERKELLDEERIQVLLLKARVFIDIQPFSSAFDYSKLAYEESLKLGDKFLLFDSARIYALVLQYLGFSDLSNEKLLQAKSVFEDIEIQNTPEYLLRKAHVLKIIGDQDFLLYIEKLKESMSIFEQLGDDYEKAWLHLTFYGTFRSTGNNVQAVKHVDKGMLLFSKIGNLVGQSRCSTLRAATHLHEGDLDTALGYSLKALAFAEVIDSPYLLGGIYADLGFYYWQKRDLDASLQYYNKSIEQIKRGNHIGHIHYPAVNFRLVLVYLEQGKIEEAKQHLEKIEIVATVRSFHEKVKINYSYMSISYMSIYKLAQSILLKTISFEENQNIIEQLLLDVLQEESFYIEMNRLALFHLCDFYLMKLKETNDPEVLKPLNNTIEKLDKMAEKQKSSILLAETYLLKSHLALIELRIEDAKSNLEIAQKIADEKDIVRLATLISNEHDHLLEQISNWESFIGKLPNIADRMELTHLEDMMTKLSKNRISYADVTLDVEAPTIFLIMNNTGHVVFSDNFEDIPLESDLSEGIISAIHEYLEEETREINMTHRLRCMNYNLILHQSSELILCYVFVGKSYSALQKFNRLINDLISSTQIWKDLQIKVKVKEELNLEDRTKLTDYLESIFL